MIKKSVQRLFIVIIIVLAVKILGVVLTKSSPNGILFYQSLTSVLVTLTLILVGTGTAAGPGLHQK